jgi:N6-L-threonylcarbamoyladenine synthase
MPTTILAIESSCDETAVAILRHDRGHIDVLASEISSQIDIHREFGGVVPELASRNHSLHLRPLIEIALEDAGVSIDEIDAFGATAGPGLASSLLVGNTTAKSLALATGKPFISVNHMEGHLLSPFLGQEKLTSNLALIVSGGHTLLIHMQDFGNYSLLGSTRDDAAGEAYDKVGKMLGLPYPGGPEIEKQARSGSPTAF